MYLEYGDTTVDISELFIVPQASDDNIEVHKTLTGKTVATYETALHARRWQLTGRVTEAKRVALKELWELVNGSETPLMFTDINDDVYEVRWIDETFPSKRTAFALAEGTITIEEI